MLKKLVGIFIGLIVMMLWGCIDPIDLIDKREDEAVIVVNGRMTKTDQGGSVVVEIFRSSVGTTRFQNVLAQEVLLINEKDEQLSLIRLEPGLYEGFPTIDFPFVYGERYKIRAVVNPSEVFESEYVLLSQSPPINSASFEYIPPARGIFGEIALNVNTTIGSDAPRNILRWDVFETYRLTEEVEGDPRIGKTCYITDKISQRHFKSLDGKVVETDVMFDYTAFTQGVTNNHGRDVYFTIVQEAIDEETDQYYQILDNIVNREGGLFETPPGRIITNMKAITNTTREVQGYFYAAQQDTVRFFVRANQIGSPRSHCPTAITPAGPANIGCVNCLILRGSTVTRPFFWIE